MNNDIYGGKDPKNIMRGRQNRAQGNHFEQIIMTSCEYYKDMGIAHIEKTPEPFHVVRTIKELFGKALRLLFVGFFEKKAQPDFKGTLKGGQSIVFEAKSTEKDRITQDYVTEEQTKSLDIHAQLGAQCYVFVCFDIQEFYFVPWGMWRNMKQIYGRKYLTEADIAQYRVRFDGCRIRFLRETEGGEHPRDMGEVKQG